MANSHQLPQGPFDIPDVYDYIHHRLKPWIFIFFVIIIQLSGGVYLASVSQMVGTTALMREDIMMAGYASLIGMSINFAVMFRMKFRFSVRTQLLSACIVLIAANMICANTDSVAILVTVCFIAGWFRMQATFACNSTIQLWLTPVRDMSVFFSYVYLVVDGAIQLNGLVSVYTSFFFQWQYMHWIIIGLLALMMVVVLMCMRPVHVPLHIPLLGIDWLGAVLWTGFMMCFTFICVYGDWLDWLESEEIIIAIFLCVLFLCVNIWRATFLHHPYISIMVLTNRNMVRAIIVYVVFYTLIATEHVFEHAYAMQILGFDETNLIDLNWYVFAGVLTGCAFTYITFARCKWCYRTMTIIGFSLAVAYLAWFYFGIDYGVEKQDLFIPLFTRGVATVVISIVFLTSIVQSGLPFMIFPQALAINGFSSAVLGSVLGSAVIGELLQSVMSRNVALIGSSATANYFSSHKISIGDFQHMVQMQALVESIKEIYGFFLLLGLLIIILLLVSYNPIRPIAIFPKWKTISSILRHNIRVLNRVSNV